MYIRMFIDVVVKYLPQRSYKFEGRNRLESRNLTIKGTNDVWSSFCALALDASLETALYKLGP